MLEDPKNDPLSIRSRIQKITLWAYAQSLYERTLKDPKNDPLSVRSRIQKMTLWANAQGPKNNPLSVRSIAVWVYAQSPFERALKNPKNDPLSVRSRAHFGWTFLPPCFGCFQLSSKVRAQPSIDKIDNLSSFKSRTWWSTASWYIPAKIRHL